MRDNRTYGSEGGEAKAFPTPIVEPRYPAAPLANMASMSRAA